MIGVLLAAAALLPSGQVRAEDSSASDWVRKGLASVCVPAVRAGTSIEDAAKAAGFTRARAARDDAGATGRTWQAPSPLDVTIVDWGDGACSVRSRRGDGPALARTADEVIRAQQDGFMLGSSPDVSPRLTQVAYCDRTRPGPLVVSLATARHPRQLAFSSTVFRSRSGDPAFCRRSARP